MIGDTQSAKLQLWDTAGAEQFRAITNLYFKNTSAALLVFDVTEVNSFKNLDNWVKNLEDLDDQEEGALKFVIGNKSDMSDDQTVSTMEGEKYAASINAEYHEISAKSGSGVAELFERVAFMLHFRDE